MNSQDSFTPFGWPIVVYLTLAGLACGATCCAVYFLRSKAKAKQGQSYSIVRTSLYVAAAAILVGVLLLVFDLKSSDRFYLNFLEFNPSSAIAWGTRIITLFFMLCIFSLILLRRVNTKDRSNPIGPILTGLLIFFALAVGIYPALVLGQATIARPLWEPLLLIPMFLLLGLHSGFALVQLLTLNKWTDKSLEQIRKLDLGAIVIQVVLFALLILVTHFSSAGKDQLFFGQLSLWFWIGVVVIGWAIPFIMSSRSSPSKNTIMLTQLCFLCGAVSLRTIIVFSGQGAQAFLGS